MKALGLKTLRGLMPITMKDEVAEYENPIPRLDPSPKRIPFGAFTMGRIEASLGQAFPHGAVNAVLLGRNMGKPVFGITSFGREELFGSGIRKLRVHDQGYHSGLFSLVINTDAP
jgi:hypothetical protein